MSDRRSLAVDIGGVSLPAPVLVASGCAGTGRELGTLCDLRRLGGAVTRTITVSPRQGSAPPRIAETGSGLVWSTGQQNPGIDAFVATELPRWAAAPTPMLVSIGGGTLEEYVRLAGALQGHDGVAGIEIALWGPDTELDRPVLGAHADRVTEVVGAVARMSLGPCTRSSPAVLTSSRSRSQRRVRGRRVARSARRHLRSRSTRRARGRHWRSGRVVVGTRAQADDAPRGRRCRARAPADADPRIRRGPHCHRRRRGAARRATAVQVGVATLVDPETPVAIARGVAAELQARAMTSPGQLRGAAVPAGAPTSEVAS